MKMTSSEIESIVRRVLQSVQPDVLAAPSAGAEFASSNSSPGVLSISSRLLTSAQLEGRLAGVTTLRVTPRAVITPLVGDLLRERGITIERCEAACESTLRELRLCWSCDRDASSQSKLPQPPALPGVRWERTDESTMATADEAVWVTSTWAKAVVELNRNPNIRAVAVDRLPRLDEALGQMSPTHLVIPSGVTSGVMSTLMQRFAEFRRNGSETGSRS